MHFTDYSDRTQAIIQLVHQEGLKAKRDKDYFLAKQLYLEGIEAIDQFLLEVGGEGLHGNRLRSYQEIQIAKEKFKKLSEKMEKKRRGNLLQRIWRGD